MFYNHIYSEIRVRICDHCIIRQYPVPQGCKNVCRCENVASSQKIHVAKSGKYDGCGWI